MPSTAQDATYALGRQGWVLERFGTDVTILRTAGSPTAASQDAALLLSCEERRGRLRLTLPGVQGPLATSSGRMLIRAYDARGSVVARLVARYRGPDDTTLVVVDAGRSDHPVAALGRMLGAMPAAFELLVYPGNDFVRLRGLIPLRLALSAGSRDLVAFRDFTDACSDPGGPR